MENAENNKKGKLMKLLVSAWIIAATLGGCVISLNIQKNNNDIVTGKQIGRAHV